MDDTPVPPYGAYAANLDDAEAGGHAPEDIAMR